MDPILEKIQTLWETLLANNKQTSKIEALKAVADDESILEFLRLMYSPAVTFGITTAIVEKGEEAVTPDYDLLQLLRCLEERLITGHAARDTCYTYMQKQKAEHNKLLQHIFNRDLKAGIDSKLVHKVYPKLFNLFEVALAKNIKDHKKGHDLLNEDNYVVERKLDGVRLIAIKQDNTVELYSRTGQRFTCLEQLKKDLIEVPGEWVLDGELAVLKDGLDDFKEAVSRIRRKDEQMDNYTYVVFDKLTIPEFYGTVTSPRYSDRLTRVDTMQVVHGVKPVSWSLFEKDSKSITQQLTSAKELGWEGLIARRDVPYKSGRGWDLLKLKFFEDAEFKVIGFEPCMQGMLRDGIMQQTECLGALLIDYKGNSVGVGTGFSQEERLEIWKNKDKYLGKTVTIQYQGESQDKDGKLSLRIPSFKGWRETGKEML